MVKGRIKEDWTKKEPTEGQITAIENMQVVLHEDICIPKTRGECSSLIPRLIKRVGKQIEMSWWVQDADWEWHRDGNSIFDI